MWVTACQSYADETDDILNAFSQTIFTVRIIITHHPLVCPTSKNHKDSDLAEEEATILCLLFCHHKLLLCKAQNCLQSELMHCLAENHIGSVTIRCLNMCNIWVSIYVLNKRKIGKFYNNSSCTDNTPHTTLKVKQSLYWPLGLQKVEAPRISRQLALQGGKVVSPTHRRPLPPRGYPWYPFLLGAESTVEP
jgi:hypothetical protein